MEKIYKKAYFAAPILFLLVLSAYGTSLFNGFLLDDNVLIAQNPLIKSFFSVPGFFFQTFLQNYYRPLVSVSFSVDYAIWGLNPFGFHLTNVILHFLNAFLFYLLLRSISKNAGLAFISSLIFAVHPVNSITVNYLSDRGHLLVSFFMLLGLITLQRGNKRNSACLYLLTFPFFFMSFLCRENALLFPFYASLTLFANRTIFDKKNCVFLLMLFLFSAIYLITRNSFSGFSSLFLPESVGIISLKSMTSFSLAVFKYISLMLFPANIFMIRTIASPDSVFGSVSIITLFTGLTVSLFFALRRNRVAMFAIAWFFAGLLPLYLFLFYRPHMGLIMQDNQIYFSSIGFFVLIGILFNGLRERHTGKIFSILILCAIFAFYITQANRNNRLWKDQKTYCSYWSKYVPGCDIAVFNLASEHAKEKDYKKALLLYRQCLLGTTDDYEVYLNVGNIYMDSGLIEKASSFFEAALKVNPASWEAYNNLGVLYMKKRDPDNAQKSFMAALDLMPETERRGYLMKWAKLSEEAGYGGLSRLFREKAVSGT